MPPKKGNDKPSEKSTKKLQNTNKGAKKATKKWSKGKSRDPLKNAVMFDKETMDKLMNEVPKYKLITPSVISDRLKISVALAGRGLQYLATKKAIKLVSASSKFKIYTRAIDEKKEKEAAAAAAAAAAATTTVVAGEKKEKKGKAGKKADDETTA